MSIRDKVFKMRMNEFGFSPVCYLGNPDKDDFPKRINIVVHEKHEPRKVFSVELNDYVLSRENTFVIGTLEWNDHEPCWEFSSCGTRFLEYANQELCEWILKFCDKYEVTEEGELIEVRRIAE